MRSLRTSLGLGLAASLALLLGTFWWAGSLTARSFAEARAYAGLEDDAASVRASLARPGLGPPRLWPDYDRPASGRWFEVRFDGGAVIESRSAWEQIERPSPLAPGRRVRGRRFVSAIGFRLFLERGRGPRYSRWLRIVCLRNRRCRRR